MKSDVYTRITSQIVAELEKGVRPWMKPWDAAHVAGPVSRPLRGNGVPYGGINVLMLWVAAMERGYAAPIWMTFRQAKELGAHVKKGEKGSLVVYANTYTRTDANEDGEEETREIPFMKGYTVFNVEQIDGLLRISMPDASRGGIRMSGLRMRKGSSPVPARPFATAAMPRTTRRDRMWCKCRISNASGMLQRFTPS